MMERMKTIGMAALLLLTGSSRLAAQQDIAITDFKCVITDLTGSVEPVYDNAGDACATILFNVRDTTFVIEGNLGILKRETDLGGIRIWVPKGTQRLTVKHESMYPLRNYKIPVKLVTKMSYHALIKVKGPSDGEIFDTPTTSNMHFCIGAGFNALSLQGPSFEIGIDANHHVIELGGIYGLLKSENLYFYSGETLVAGFQYQAMRAFLRYGYDIKPTNLFGIMPYVGIALNGITGTNADGANTNTDKYKKASSASFLLGLRLSVSLGKVVKLQASPEYSLGVYKSKNCELLSNHDNDIKKWTEGFGVNVGLVFNF